MTGSHAPELERQKADSLYLSFEAQRHKAEFREDLIHDPGFRLGPCTELFVSTSPFHRLCDLKQLGTAWHKFTSATHTRYAHSLGVAHLAHEWASTIYRHQGFELGMEPKDIEIIELAGACHDLGHGPFSHVFEKEILPGLGIADFHHEEMSCRMLDAAQDQACFDEADYNLTSADMQKVKDLIKGNARPLDKAFMFDIVANSRNGLDVDKLDYLPRDAYHTVRNIPGDFKRLQHFISVSNDEICFAESEWGNVHAVYDARRRMHQEVYQHPSVISTSKMVSDILVAAEPVLNIRNCISDPKKFLRLGDSVLQTLRSQHGRLQDDPALDVDGTQEGCLRQAMSILERIERRDYYALVGECVQKPESCDKIPTPADLMKESASSGQHLREEDIIVHQACIDYSQRDRNPMDSVSFLDSKTGQRVHHKQDDYTILLNTQYQERKVMIFSKSPCPDAQEALSRAWSNWHRQHFGHHAKSTPSKPTASGRSRKRQRPHAGRHLDMNGHATIPEGIEFQPDDDSDVFLSQGSFTCSQELMLSQNSLP